MGTSGTESYEGCLWTQFKHLRLQRALKLSLVRLMTSQTHGSNFFVYDCGTHYLNCHFVYSSQ